MFKIKWMQRYLHPVKKVRLLLNYGRKVSCCFEKIFD